MATYRTSIGDIQDPDYSGWIDLDTGEWNKNIVVGVIWFVWLMTSFINVIILLNFLIAVIS